MRLSSPGAGRSTRSVALIVCLTFGCTPGPPGLAGGPATSPAPSAPWAAPDEEKERAAKILTRDSVQAVPPDLAERVNALTLTDVVDLALRNNPATQQSWANAREAAAAYGSSRGAWFPSLDLDGSAVWVKTTATQGRSATQQTVLSPSLSISWLLLDFGGRTGATRGAREALVAADWTHNATIQNVVLGVQAAFFQYMGTRALLAAQQATIREQEKNLEAAEQRHQVGVATIADVLQAKTALSQAQLDAITTEGALATARGALAVSMGLPANLPYDVDSLAGQPPVTQAADSVDSLITQAIRARPDLAAAEAQVRQSEALITERRGARLPTLFVNGASGYSVVAGRGPLQNNYTVTLGLQIPLFNGFSREYDQQAAEAAAAAARAGARSLEQQVIFQVFSSYHAFQTATRRVQTADDLLASAQQSSDVALGRYKEGVGSVIDLLTAESALAAARAQQVEAHWGWQTALAQLSHDTGLLDERGRSGIRLDTDSTEAEPGQ
jgi:outer membrane protein TolC